MTTGFDGSTYTYDAQNRLLSATTGGTTDTFLYDGLNRQIGKKVGTGAMYYRVYDGWDLLGEYKTGATGAYATYLYGATGVIKNLMTNNYYYQDASGSTSHLGDSNGALLEWYRYDLHGTPVFYNALNQQRSTTNYGVRHLFTGQQWYSELGLYDLRNRYYSPDVGRFLQSDPASFGGDTTNLYRYCGNNPLTRFDPSGLLSLPPLPYEYGGVTVNGTDPSFFGSPTYNPSTPSETGWLSYSPGSPFTGLTFSPGSNPFGGITPFHLTIQTGVGLGSPQSILPAFNLSTPYSTPVPSGAPATSITFAAGPGAGIQVTVTWDEYGQMFISVAGQIGKSWPYSLSMTGVSVIGQPNPTASQIAASVRGLGWNATGGFFAGGQLSGPANWAIVNPFSTSGAGPASTWGVGFVTPQGGISLGYTWQTPTLASPFPPYNSPGGP